MFKKMLAVMAIIAAGTTAQAEDRLTVGYRYDNFGAPYVPCSAAARCSEITQTNYVINYDSRINDKLQIGLGLRLGERNSYSASNNNRLTNRYMLRINYDVNDYVYINSAVGSKKQSLTPSTNFWQTEVGVKYRINDSWQIRAGYKYREGFDGKVQDYYEGPAYRIQYTINPRYNVQLQYEDLKFLNEDRGRLQFAVQKRLF
jgi:outer membrane autotransporter protein